MAKQSTEGLAAKKEENVSEWYEQVCLKGKLAEFSKVKGSIVMRPSGYAVWEKIQEYFNKNIVDKSGAENAYFPLFIPESFFHKEAEHAKGFSPEVAWIDKSLTGDGERLAIRPTSETIMYDSYSGWIRSYKDLPLKINQWCNVVRWETKATRLFLRSREFLWQEGHCVYETEKECDKETVWYINEYKKLCEDLLAMPVIVGKKTEKEKFAGAKYTLTIEAFMPDGKALQSGTSHNLGQGFAKAFDINFEGKDGKSHLPWQNSWGLSTRLIGGMVMTHSDNKGLVLPPKVAKNKVVIIPILIKGKEEKVLKKAKEIEKSLEKYNVILDDDKDYSPGFKFNKYELEGIPLRIEIGPRDLEKNQIIMARRDTSEKQDVKIKDIEKTIEETLELMQKEMFKKAKKELKSKIIKTTDIKELKKIVNDKKIALTPFCGKINCEEKIKDETGASSRCFVDDKETKEKCIKCGKEKAKWIYFSKSY
ncbi:proline--tRNA ligase [Candidatus Pacearchaeota archaeon]|nr:proline--tRNA ligase [Candidatus Pacearchaeota archaeon]